MNKNWLIALLTVSLACISMAAETSRAVPPSKLLTVAEATDYRETATHADVMALARQLADRSTHVHLDEIGRSVEDRQIPLLIIADPPVTTSEEARESGKLVALLIGNIHAGEVCGKEALMMLAREIGDPNGHSLLEEMIACIVPIYNADGNERMAKDNRPGQVGPGRMGVRANAQNLDLNRDFVKQAAPETQALARFLRVWDPHMVIDTHTTNGSFHRYVLTYAGPKNIAGDGEVIRYVRDTMLPHVSETLQRQCGHDTFFYGVFNKEHTTWRTYPDTPRYGTPYRGLRNRIAILSEAYAYAPFKDRVIATRDFCRSCLKYAAQNTDTMNTLFAEADERQIRAGTSPGEDDLVPIRTRLIALPEKITVKGWVEQQEDGRRERTSEPQDYDVQFVSDFEATLSVRRPWAYLLPNPPAAVIENLKRHGIQLDVLREDIELDTETYRVDSIKRYSKEYEGHRLVKVSATALPRVVRVAAGTVLLRTAQRLGALAVVLLEPASSDGLTAWNFFDQSLAEGAEFPVLRLLDPVPLIHTELPPLDEDRTFDKRVTYEQRHYAEDRPNFNRLMSACASRMM